MGIQFKIPKELHVRDEEKVILKKDIPSELQTLFRHLKSLILDRENHQIDNYEMHCVEIHKQEKEN